MKKALACLLLLAGLHGCTETNDVRDDNDPASSLDNVMDHRSGKHSSRAWPRLKAERLGADQRRVMLFVVPGDASIEVDGRPMFRRNGLIELVGKAGETRMVRVFKGARSTEEKTVTIGEGEAIPALIDLNEAVPVVAGPKTKKAKPLVFGDIDE